MDFRLSAILVPFLAASLVGCSDAGKSGAAAATPAAPQPLLISPEDLLTVRSDSLAARPSITGSLQPERRADLRAEVAAVVLQVLKENGDPVRRGDLLLRLDDTAIRETLTSAQASTRAASQGYEQAERQFQRLAKLRESGVVSTQQLEDTEIQRNTAQSDLAAARTRAAVARQQLARTEVQAPFDGVVSDRKVSAGDTAQIGMELVRVIDPASMRFEGMVSANQIGEVKTGQHVVFRVHGFADREFDGVIARVNPAADATTRQVAVLVEFSEAGQAPRVAGLYAEGHIQTRSTTALTVPASAIVKEGDRAFAWRLQKQMLRRVSLELGERDARSGEIAVRSGVTAGDLLLRYPSAALQDGQKVELAAATSSAQQRPAT